MSELRKRIRRSSLHERIMSAEDTIPFFRDGMDLGWSGFTPVGYPKVVPLALADYVEKNNLQGKMRFNLFIGASIGAEVEDRWASLLMTDKRWPYQSGKVVQKQVNDGTVRMGDKHLSLYAQDLAYGFYTKQLIQEYFERARREGFAKGAGHEPHLLFKAFKMQQHLEEHGTMKISSWE